MVSVPPPQCMVEEALPNVSLDGPAPTRTVEKRFHRRCFRVVYETLRLKVISTRLSRQGL